MSDQTHRLVNMSEDGKVVFQTAHDPKQYSRFNMQDVETLVNKSHSLPDRYIRSEFGFAYWLQMFDFRDFYLTPNVAICRSPKVFQERDRQIACMTSTFPFRQAIKAISHPSMCTTYMINRLFQLYLLAGFECYKIAELTHQPTRNNPDELISSINEYRIAQRYYLENTGAPAVLDWMVSPAGIRDILTVSRKILPMWRIFWRFFPDLKEKWSNQEEALRQFKDWAETLLFLDNKSIRTVYTVLSPKDGRCDRYRTYPWICWLKLIHLVNTDLDLLGSVSMEKIRDVFFSPFWNIHWGYGALRFITNRLTNELICTDDEKAQQLAYICNAITSTCTMLEVMERINSQNEEHRRMKKFNMKHGRRRNTAWARSHHELAIRRHAH